MDQSVIQRQRLLKKALTVNAVFSVFSGVVILLANRWLVQFLGLSDQVSLTILGVSLIIFAMILWLNARRPRIRIVDAWVAVIMDCRLGSGQLHADLSGPFQCRWKVGHSFGS